MPFDQSNGFGQERTLNVLNTPLVLCGCNPVTGFFRDGCCNTCEDDRGLHTVCAVMSETFLQFTKSCGNDLSTPMPFFEFPGLKPGDRWCLCAGRWLEAYEAGFAPKIILAATHIQTLEIIPLEILRQFSTHDEP